MGNIIMRYLSSVWGGIGYKLENAEHLFEELKKQP